MHGSSPLQLIEHVFHILSTAARNRCLRAALNTCLGVVLVLLLLRAVPAGAVLTHLQPRNLWPLFGLLGLTLLSQLIRAVRWMILLRGLTRVGYLEALWVNATTQLLNFLIPVRAGEAARLWWLRRRRVSLVGGLGMVVIDHGFDLCGVALVLGTGALMRWIGVGGRLPSMPQMLVPLGLALATFGAIGLTILAGPRMIGSRYARRMLRPTWHDRASRHASAIRGAARQLRCRRRLSLVIATSAAAVAVDGLAFSMLFMSLGLAVPLLGAIVTQVTLLYTYLLPSAPGYLGSLEAGGTLLLTSGLGLPSGTAAGAMVLWHALAAVMVVALGLVAVQQLRRQRPLIGLTPASRTRQNR